MTLFYDGDTDPVQFITEFQEDFHRAVVEDDEDLASVVDRFHTSDIVQVADGHVMDRAKLIAHCRPTRKTRPVNRVEVSDAMAEGDRLAARFRMHVERPRGDRVDRLVVHVHFFGRFAPDGRMREANMLTRMERSPGQREAADPDAGERSMS